MNEPTVTAEVLNDLRQRYLAGKSWTREELKSAIHTMIGQRLTDVQSAATPKTKTKAAPINLDDLLADAAPEPQVPKATEPKATKTGKVSAAWNTDFGGFF